MQWVPQAAPDSATLPPWFDGAMIDALADALVERIAPRVLEQLRPVQHRVVLHDDDVLDSKEAVEYCRIASLDALHRLSAAGTIPTLQRKPGGRLRFRKCDLDDWLAGDL